MIVDLPALLPVGTTDSAGSIGMLTPERARQLGVGQVTVLYVPDPRQPRPAFLHTIVESICTDARCVDLSVVTWPEGDAAAREVHIARELHRRPALVIAKPWRGGPGQALEPEQELPAYGVIDDARLFDDLPRLTRAAATLALVVAAATTPELAAALRTRRFRMLVWNASSRLGAMIGYLTDVQIRFVVGATQLALCFDARGWAADRDPQSAAASPQVEEARQQRAREAATTQAISEMISEGGPIPRLPHHRPVRLREGRRVLTR